MKSFIYFFLSRSLRELYYLYNFYYNHLRKRVISFRMELLSVIYPETIRKELLKHFALNKLFYPIPLISIFYLLLQFPSIIFQLSKCLLQAFGLHDL